MAARKERLKRRIGELCKENPTLSPYLASKRLSLPEERVLREWIGHAVERVLSSALPSIWRRLDALGPCRVEIRNEHAVVELNIEAFQLDGDSGEARLVGSTFSVTLDLGRIEGAYFVDLRADAFPSIEFYSRRGKAVFKIYVPREAAASYGGLRRNLTEPRMQNDA